MSDAGFPPWEHAERRMHRMCDANASAPPYLGTRGPLLPVIPGSSCGGPLAAGSTLAAAEPPLPLILLAASASSPPVLRLLWNHNPLDPTVVKQTPARAASSGNDDMAASVGHRGPSTGASAC